MHSPRILSLFTFPFSHKVLTTVISIGLISQVLCSAWKDDGTTVFTGGCDKQVKMWPLLSGGQPTTVAMHDAPVKEVAWIPQMNLLVSGSWDKTVRCFFFFKVKQARCPLRISLIKKNIYKVVG